VKVTVFNRNIQIGHTGAISSVNSATGAVCKVRRLAAVRRCYAEVGGDLCQVVVVGVT